MKPTLIRLHREENGQVMLLALITAVFLVLVMAFPLNVGWTISKRIKLQNAADAAAYSAAVVQADGLSAIAWLNNAMSWCYQRQYGLELKFCTFGVYALLEKWGDNTSGCGKPQNDDYDLDGVAWYQDFRNKVNNKTPIDAFNDFMNNEARLISRERNGYEAEKRTLEMWIRMLRVVAETIAQQLPRMMRYEAMRIAYLNTYDGTVGSNRNLNQVYMAFFPDENSDPVKLDFTPNRNFSRYSGNVANDDSFLQYERWHDKSGGGCRFVERAMQIAADQRAFFMGSGFGKQDKINVTNELGDHHIIDGSGKLNMSSIDSKDEKDAWYNEYDGQPRRMSGKYLAFAKTVICWHKEDKDGKGGHSSPGKTPCGHWHVSHTHLHYNCTHITITIPFDGAYHFHIPIPMVHEDGHEKNRWCLNDYKCPMWSAPTPGCGCVGVGDIQAAINEGISAAQQAVNQWTALVQQAQEAYNHTPDQAHLDALNAAKAQLQNAQDNLQAILNAATVASGAMGLNPIMETHINLSVIPMPSILPEQGILLVNTGEPGKGTDIKEWRHHAIHYCPLCFTMDGTHNREFPKSEVADYHGLAYYRETFWTPDQPQRADHHFYLPSVSSSLVELVKGKKKSMVRAYIADLLSPAYSNWFNFKKEAAFHQIHKSNYSPELPAPAPGRIETNLCPTIVFKPVSDAADKHNFFNWGITVALWQKHHSIMFRKYTADEGSGGVFMEIEGMLALASAKVGIRVNSRLYADMSDRTGAAKYFPQRLICGIGEKSRAGEPSGPYTAAYMRERFLANRDRKEPILNLFHTDWGARLIPIQKSVPEAESARAAKFVLAQTHRIYYWQNKNSEPGVLNERIASSKWTGIDGQGWSNEDWEFLTRLLVH